MEMTQINDVIDEYLSMHPDVTPKMTAMFMISYIQDNYDIYHKRSEDDIVDEMLSIGEQV